MSDKLDLAQIRQFWTEQAEKHGDSPDASWSDTPVIGLEIKQLIQRLCDGDHVLDVGCANGYTTIQLASQRRLRIKGVDYIPEMITHARRNLSAFTSKLPSSVEFDVGNVLELAEPDSTYDKVVVVRVIINLRDWRHQAGSLAHCIRVLKPGGELLLSEATLQGWQSMNRFRKEWGLQEIAMPSFNQYLDEEQVVKELKPVAELVDIVN
ncbi:MAG: class I SAM-dependent methyltransferase, partial [Candidatus Hydrogenedentota bacterium]